LASIVNALPVRRCVNERTSVAVWADVYALIRWELRPNVSYARRQARRLCAVTEVAQSASPAGRAEVNQSLTSMFVHDQNPCHGVTYVGVALRARRRRERGNRWCAPSKNGIVYRNNARNAQNCGTQRGSAEMSEYNRRQRNWRGVVGTKLHPRAVAL